MKIVMILLLTAVSIQANADKNVVLAERIEAKTQVQDPNSPYCIKSVYVSMTNSVTNYSGPTWPGGEYSCAVEFDYVNPEIADGPVQRGRRSYSYIVRPKQVKPDLYLGSKLRDTYGFLTYFQGMDDSGMNQGAIADYLWFGVPNSIINSLYSTVDLFSEIFATDFEGEAMKQMPVFKDIYAAQRVACEIASLEALDQACADSRDKILSETTQKIENLRLRESMYPKLIPKKPNEE